MPNVVLVVIAEPDPEERSIIAPPIPVPSPLKPFLIGDGDINLLCGECGFQLAEGLSAGQVAGVVFQCPRCMKYNDSRI